MSSEELDLCLIEVAGGSMTAFRQLYDKMSDSIFKYAFSLVHDRQAAEDIMQDTFIRVYRHANLYQRNTKPTAWMYRITRNCCMDYLKRANREIILDTATILDVTEQESFSETSTDKEAVIQALNHLEELERTIVTLYLVMGMKQTEIAKYVHLPYPIVRSKYRYAIKKLRHYFADKG